MCGINPPSGHPISPFFYPIYLSLYTLNLFFKHRDDLLERWPVPRNVLPATLHKIAKKVLTIWRNFRSPMMFQHLARQTEVKIVKIDQKNDYIHAWLQSLNQQYRIRFRMISLFDLVNQDYRVCVLFLKKRERERERGRGK